MASTALVTGGTGFYGSHLCERLLTEGWTVHATSRLAAEDSCGRVTFHVADLQDPDAAKRTLDSVAPDVIYHFAGSASAAPKLELVLPTHHSQVTSALNLLTLATGRFVRRLVLIGSLMEPFGNIESAVPSSPYSASKIAVVNYGRMFHRIFEAPVVIVRPFMTFGPRQAASHVLPYVIRSLAAGEAPRLSSGLWKTDWIYIDDVVEGLIRAGSYEGIEGETIELGRGELRSVKDMVMQICGLMKTDRAPLFGEIEDRPDEPIRAANLTAARKLIGWTPQVGIEEGLRRTIEWYRDTPRKT